MNDDDDERRNRYDLERASRETRMRQFEEAIPLKQAYLAMYAYLDALYERTKVGEISDILLDMSFISEDETFDQAAWSDWMNCVEKARDNKVDTRVFFQEPEPPEK